MPSSSTEGTGSGTAAAHATGTMTVPQLEDHVTALYQTLQAQEERRGTAVQHVQDVRDATALVYTGKQTAYLRAQPFARMARLTISFDETEVVCSVGKTRGTFHVMVQCRQARHR